MAVANVSRGKIPPGYGTMALICQSTICYRFFIIGGLDMSLYNHSENRNINQLRSRGTSFKSFGEFGQWSIIWQTKDCGDCYQPNARVKRYFTGSSFH